MKQEEQWRKIPHYEDYYEASDLGQIKSLRFNKILKPYLVRDKGCYVVGLCKEGKRKTIKIHRLIALAFLQPDTARPFVNHKNGIRTDNRLSNLEFCSYQENASHSRLFLREKKTRFIGVSFHKHAKRWTAKLWINKKHKNLGYFETEIEAARAYSKALRNYGIVNKYATIPINLQSESH